MRRSTVTTRTAPGHKTKLPPRINNRLRPVKKEGGGCLPYLLLIILVECLINYYL